MSAGLIGDHIRTHTTLHQFRNNVGRVRAQRNRNGFTLTGVFVDTRQRVIQRCGLLIHIAGTQTEIDTALLTFNVKRTRARQRRG